MKALHATRVIQPGFNNWLLFSATIEACFCSIGADWDKMRVDYAVRQHEQWYKGDGIYGDGPSLHWDYYNSFVIHPMLLAVLDAVSGAAKSWETLRAPILQRARRYAAIQERLISPEGTVSGDRAVAGLSLRSVSGAGADGAAEAVAGRCVAGAGTWSAYRGHPQMHRSTRDLRRATAG